MPYFSLDHLLPIQNCGITISGTDLKLCPDQVWHCRESAVSA